MWRSITRGAQRPSVNVRNEVLGLVADLAVTGPRTRVDRAPAFLIERVLAEPDSSRRRG